MTRYKQTEGIQCRYCGCRMTTVETSKKYDVHIWGKSKTIIKRYRRCRHCGLCFTTVETYEDEQNPLQPEPIDSPAPPPPPIVDFNSESLPQAPLQTDGDLVPPKKRRSPPGASGSSGGRKGRK